MNLLQVIFYKLTNFVSFWTVVGVKILTWKSLKILRSEDLFIVLFNGGQTLLLTIHK